MLIEAAFATDQLARPRVVHDAVVRIVDDVLAGGMVQMHRQRAEAEITPEQVRARMAPFRECRCSVERRMTRYLAATHALVEPFYRLEKDGGFAPRDPRGVGFAADRLAAGASELRDLIVLAWRASADVTVGYPVISVADIEAGKVDPYDALYGQD